MARRGVEPQTVEGGAVRTDIHAAGGGGVEIAGVRGKVVSRVFVFCVLCFVLHWVYSHLALLLPISCV